MSEVSVTLKDLMYFQHMVYTGQVIPNRRVFSILSGRHVSKLRGRGLDFEEVRFYVKGDDIRNIDWKVTARTKKTHTKVFTEEKERPAMVVVDQSSKMLFGSRKYLKSVIAAEISALAVFKGLKSGDRVGAFVFDDNGMERIAPQRNMATAQRIMKTISDKNQALLQVKQVKSNRERLNEVLSRIAATAAHDYVITVVSDFSDMDEETKRHITHISRHNNLILVHIYDELEKELPATKILLSDGKKQLRWDGAKASNREGFKSAFDELEDKLKHLSKFGIPVAFMNTSQDTIQQIKDKIAGGF